MRILLFAISLLLSTATFAQRIDKRSGIPIHFTMDAGTFPTSWKSAEIAAYGMNLDSSEFERSYELMTLALSKYPVEVLQSNLKKIYVLRTIQFYGQPFGGTNSSDVVYISNDGFEQGYTNRYIETSFHHEFSSILLRNYPEHFEKARWTKLNTIPYGDGGVAALKTSQDSQEFDKELQSQGFLHQYAASSMENDFNAFAEQLFCPANRFKTAVKKHRKIATKYELILLFYFRINSELSQAYFERLNGLADD